MPLKSVLSMLAVLLGGSALILTGLYVLSSGGMSLPTRHPPQQFHFSGLSLFLLGLPPLVAGVLSLAIGCGFVHRESKTTHWAILISIASLCLAFILAPKV